MPGLAILVAPPPTPPSSTRHRQFCGSRIRYPVGLSCLPTNPWNPPTNPPPRPARTDTAASSAHLRTVRHLVIHRRSLCVVRDPHSCNSSLCGSTVLRVYEMGGFHCFVGSIWAIELLLLAQLFIVQSIGYWEDMMPGWFEIW
jgi:hypothetical protein